MSFSDKAFGLTRFISSHKEDLLEYHNRSVRDVYMDVLCEKLQEVKLHTIGHWLPLVVVAVHCRVEKISSKKEKKNNAGADI